MKPCELVLSGAWLAAGCDPGPDPDHPGDHDRRPARNEIVMIGDGMSLPQIAFLTQYRRIVYPEQPESAFERILRDRYFGLADTNTVLPDGWPTLTVDSAASATQIGCGVMSIPQVTGLTQEGYPCQTALERAKTLGMATGLVTDTRITHATPGAFVAKQVSRSAENEIAAESITGPAAGKVDVLVGGGAQHFLPSSMQVNQVPECASMAASLVTAGPRPDTRNVMDEARAAGYELVCNEQQLLAVMDESGAKVLGTFAGSSYPPLPERTTVPGLPPLETMARKAIRILEQDRDGFFIMIEAATIDYAGHDHDGAFLLRAMQEAGRILGFLLDSVDAHPDTLLVVLGDHETGTPVFSYPSAPPVTTRLPSGLVHTMTYDFGDAVAKYALFEHQTLSLEGMVDPIIDELYLRDYQPNPAYPIDQGITDLIAIVEANSDFEITRDEARRVLTIEPGTTTIPYDGLADRFYDATIRNRLARVLTDQTHLLWATGQHTSLPVIVMAAGPKALADQVRGYYHTTDVGRLLFEALGR